MSKKIPEVTEWDTRAFYLKSDYASFVDSNKSGTKASHFLNYGYDFAKIAAAIAKYKGYIPEPLKKDQEKIFGKDEFQNNPLVDLVFQIIAYSKIIKENHENDENHFILSDLNKCREIGEIFSNSGFQFVIDNLFKATEDEVNSLMVDFLSDQKLLIEDLDDFKLDDWCIYNINSI